MSAENEFQLSYTPGSLSLPLSASPSFPPGQAELQESPGRTQLWGWIFRSHQASDAWGGYEEFGDVQILTTCRDFSFS